MRPLRSLFVVFVALSAFAVSSVAGAQTADERNRARQLYTEAQALFEAGNHAQAEASFRAAYAAVPSPVVLKAIAAAQEHQGNISGAIETLEQYLQAAPQAQDHAQVQQQLTGLRGRPAVVAISSTPPGAAIWVDGRDTGHTTPHAIDMRGGQRTVELRMAGYASTQQTFTTRPGTRMRLEMNLSVGADPLGSQGGDGQGAGGGGGGGGSGASSDPSATVWIFAGVGAAGLISGTVFGFLALSEQSSFDLEPSNDAADRGETFALVADISFGLAAAGAITAIVLYIVESSGGGGDSEAASIAPWATQNGGGVAARLRF